MKEHKCDMYCLWEDLYDSYEQCRKCIHNRNDYYYPCRDYRIDTDMMDCNDHLWRKKPDLNYEEYKKWLERKKRVSDLGLKVV